MKAGDMSFLIFQWLLDVEGLGCLENTHRNCGRLPWSMQMGGWPTLYTAPSSGPRHAPCSICSGDHKARGRGGEVMDAGASCTDTKSETLRPSISELSLLFPSGVDTVHQRGSFLSFLFSPILLCLHSWPLLRRPLSLYSLSWLHLMFILIT